MRLAINVFQAALAASCLAIAACEGNGSTDSPASPNSFAIAASIKTATPSTGSLNGTSIPSATQITDSGGNVWTVSGGVVYKNGASAGYSHGATLLLYDYNIIYQENSAGAWWSWNGTTWVSSTDPRNVASLNGTTSPSAVQITDTSRNVWTVSAGVVYENGALAGYTRGAALLLYDNNIIYQENSAGAWYSWHGSTWVASSNPREVASPSGSDTSSASAQITDSSGNIWTLSGGVIYENGALAGYSRNAALLLYANNIIYQQNAAGAWYSWRGNTWVSSGDPPNASASGATSSSTGSATLSWTAPTRNSDGTPLADLSGYTIYYGTSPSALTQTIQVASPSATSYVVSGLSPGTYYFAVAADTTVETHSAQTPAVSDTIP
jgi:hypothetical protein